MSSKELELERMKAALQTEINKLQAEIENLTIELNALKMEQEIKLEERKKRQLIREYQKDNQMRPAKNKKKSNS